MLNIARRCVPFTPFDKDLATATVALVSATGVYAPGQEPFPTEDPGDVTVRTIEAATGSQALDLARERRPDLVLMDIRLPDIDGVEALSRLRADDRTASIPVLAVTAQAMQGDRERCLAAGFDGYLSKPIDVGELLEAVRRHCGMANR